MASVCSRSGYRRKRRDSRKPAGYTRQTLPTGLPIPLAAMKSTLLRHAAGLLKEMQAERALLAAWKELFPIVQHVVEHELWPLQEVFDLHMRRLILLFDRAHGHKCMGKRDNAKLDFLICDMAIELLCCDPDPELLQIYFRHGGKELSPDDVHAQQQDDYESVDGAATAAPCTFERVEIHPTPWVPATLESRQQAEAKRLQASAGEIYRGLLSELRFGLAVAESQRIPLLMQRAHAAYAANDQPGLLALLEDVERIGLGCLGKLDVETVQRYTGALVQHLRALEGETGAWAFAATVEAECSYREEQTPESLMRKLQGKLAESRAHLAQIESDIVAFDDVRQLKKWLKAYRITQAHQPYVASE